MDFDYHFGNEAYKYFDDFGIKYTKYSKIAPEQSQSIQPGKEYLMIPRPIFDNPNYLLELTL